MEKGWEDNTTTEEKFADWLSAARLTIMHVGPRQDILPEKGGPELGVRRGGEGWSVPGIVLVQRARSQPHGSQLLPWPAQYLGLVHNLSPAQEVGQGGVAMADMVGTCRDCHQPLSLPWGGGQSQVPGYWWGQ